MAIVPLKNVYLYLSQVACPEGTGGVNKPPESCGQGHYCPLGTQHKTQWPCPAGSFTNLTNLHRSEDCYTCTKGYYCVEGTVQPDSSVLCFAGHWCPPGKLSN